MMHISQSLVSLLLPAADTAPDAAVGSAELVTDYHPNFCFCTKGTDMREHVFLYCLLGLVLTAAIILVIAPGTVTWALSLMID